MARIHDPSFTNTSPDSHHLVLVGGGPRSVIQLTAELSFLHTYQDHFTHLADLGADYSLITTLVEKQSSIAPGNAFAYGHTGMANTGVEPDITFPLAGHAPQSIRHILSYKARFSKLIQQNPQQYYNRLQDINLPGAVMFRRSLGPMSSTPSGTPDHSAAYLMRRTVGEEEVQNFQQIISLADDIPFYKLNLLPDTLLEHISVANPTKPFASVRNLSTAQISGLSADQVRLNTGTVLRHPVADPAVRKLTFAQAMNASDMSEFFAQHGLLAHDGTLRSGVKVLCGGLSLSSLDQLSALDRVMNLFEEDEKSLLGYRVSERAKSIYQGAITIVSRTPGKACAVRHSASPEWQQATKVMGNTKHLHALFLHENGENVFEMWYEIVKAAVARASDRTPGELDAFQPTEELLRSRFAETLRYLDCRRKAGLAELHGRNDVKERLLRESSRTLSGAWRQAALSLITGFGLESDLEAAREEMARLAPITHKGRHGMMMHRAQIHSVTHSRCSLLKSNEKAIGNMRKLMSYVTASPVEVHSMFHLLLESGIAVFVPGSYSEITCDSSGSYLHLDGEGYDALVISPVFDRSGDKAVNSLDGQVRAIHKSAPSYGEVGKFRQFVSHNGRAIAVEDNGLGGAGFQVRDGAGKGSLVGAFAIDINNRSSAVSTAASYATRRMAMSHLKAAGVRSATEALGKIYEEGKADVDSYNAEVSRFSIYFQEAHEMCAYLKAICMVCEGDAGEYCRLYDRGCMGEGRKAVIEELKMWGGMGAAAAEQYFENLREIGELRAAGRDEYLSRFVDTTEEEDLAAYEKAFAMAERKLN